MVRFNILGTILLDGLRFCQADRADFGMGEYDGRYVAIVELGGREVRSSGWMRSAEYTIGKGTSGGDSNFKIEYQCTINLGMVFGIGIPGVNSAWPVTSPRA